MYLHLTLSQLVDDSVHKKSAMTKKLFGLKVICVHNDFK